MHFDAFRHRGEARRQPLQFRQRHGGIGSIGPLAVPVRRPVARVLAYKVRYHRIAGVVAGCCAIFLYINVCVSAGVSCSLCPSLRNQMMSTTTSFLNSMRKSRAIWVAHTTASGSSPLTCNTGASIILTTSVQYSVERESRGSEVVKPIWLLMTICKVPPVP